MIVSASLDEGHQTGDMTPEKVYDILPALRNLLKARKDFFPLANIHLMLGMEEEFRVELAAGIKKSIYLSDYRSIRYYCKMARFSGTYSQAELEELFYLIRTSAEYYVDDLAGLNDYKINEGAIRQILVPVTDRPGLTVQFTAIPKPGVVGVSARIIADLEACFHELGLSLVWHSLEINRNSPENCRFGINDVSPSASDGKSHIHHHHHHHHHHHVSSVMSKAPLWERTQALAIILNAAFTGVSALAAAAALAIQISGALQSQRNRPLTAALCGGSS